MDTELHLHFIERDRDIEADRLQLVAHARAQSPASRRDRRRMFGMFGWLRSAVLARTGQTTGSRRGSTDVRRSY
jgi:hypothetical protein